jgi:hypothetical protein
MKKCRLGAGLALVLMLIGCEPLESECPKCETQCWEGYSQCEQCYKSNSCTKEGVTDGPAV